MKGDSTVNQILGFSKCCRAVTSPATGILLDLAKDGARNEQRADFTGIYQHVFHLSCSSSQGFHLLSTPEPLCLEMFTALHGSPALTQLLLCRDSFTLTQ